MSLFTSQIKFLSILAENSKKPYAEVVYSEEIAQRLDMSLTDTHQMIRCLNDMEVIESNMEGHLSLITQKGIHGLEKYSAC
jgi:CTP-dependent riboflavin kinase